MGVLLRVIGQDGVAGTVEAAEAVFGREFNEALVHQLVVAYRANARRGTRAQKDRGAVRHSTRKPWRQKGTGRARAGMVSSPLWRGGGKIFPASPDDNFSQKVNRRMYRAGMAAILSQLAREDRLHVVEALEVAEAKTKSLVAQLRALGLSRALVITDALDRNLELAARNVPDVEVIPVQRTNPVALIRHPTVVLTRRAVARLEEMFA